MELGITVAASTGGAALLAGWLSGSWPLMATLAGSLGLGIAYSTDLPLLRWKRYPLLAAGCILSVRCCFTMTSASTLADFFGTCVRLTVVLAIQEALGQGCSSASASRGHACPKKFAIRKHWRSACWSTRGPPSVLARLGMVAFDISGRAVCQQHCHMWLAPHCILGPRLMSSRGCPFL